MIGAAIGTLTGFLVAKVGIPAFVATLAFFLAWQGVVLQIAREGGTIPINNTLIIALVNRNLSPALGWVLWAIVVLGYLGMALSRARGRAKAGLSAEPHRSRSPSRRLALAVRLGRRDVHPQRQPLVRRRHQEARRRADRGARRAGHGRRCCT